jgi:hypothetical protein
MWIAGIFVRATSISRFFSNRKNRGIKVTWIESVYSIPLLYACLSPCSVIGFNHVPIKDKILANFLFHCLGTKMLNFPYRVMEILAVLSFTLTESVEFAGKTLLKSYFYKYFDIENYLKSTVCYTVYSVILLFISIGLQCTISDIDGLFLALKFTSISFFLS